MRQLPGQDDALDVLLSCQTSGGTQERDGRGAEPLMIAAAIMEDIKQMFRRKGMRRVQVAAREEMHRAGFARGPGIGRLVRNGGQRDIKKSRRNEPGSCPPP